MTTTDKVMALVNKGIKNKDIALQLGISPSRVSALKHKYEMEHAEPKDPKQKYLAELKNRLIDIGCPSQMAGRICTNVDINNVTDDTKLLEMVNAYESGIRYNAKFEFKSFGQACAYWCKLLFHYEDVLPKTRCSVCGNIIPIGDAYFEITPHNPGKNSKRFYICKRCFDRRINKK